MHKKSTLFYLVNDFERLTGENEDWDSKMRNSDRIDTSDEDFENPSNSVVEAILDFAKSYSFIKPNSFQGIDLYLN